MITKKDITTHMSNITSNLKPSKAADLQEVIGEYLQWLSKNYEDMDEEAQAYVDHVFDGMFEIAGPQIASMPESIEKRKLFRTYKAGMGEHQRADQLLQSLESKPHDMDEVGVDGEAFALQGIQVMLDLLLDVREHKGDDFPALPNLVLLYGCVDELLAALHLARHHYYVQANSHLRTVLETLDKVKLFRLNPEWVDVWTGDDTKKMLYELSPSAVRKKLGKDRFDPLYGFLSEHGTHPSFRGFQSRAAIKLSEEPRKNVHIWVSGTPMEHLRVWFYQMALTVIPLAIVQVMLFGEPVFNPEELEHLLRQQLDNFSSFQKQHFIPWAKQYDMNVDDLETALLEHVKNIFEDR